MTRVAILLTGAVVWTTVALAQTVTVLSNVNLRPEQSTGEPPIRRLTPDEPPLTLLEPHLQDGYFHVRTQAGEEGYVLGRNVHLSTATGIGPGVPGSTRMIGCGDGLWQHVYHPTRLLVKQDCITVTGVIVDATASQSHHQPDGVRHEKDGDTHGWLKVDPQFANLIDAGNTSDQAGNLVFELVCHYTVTQTDARPSCAGFKDKTKIPAVGSHVAIRGTLVQDQNHAKWNELHPVSSITVQ